jgi:hypothetical protein
VLGRISVLRVPGSLPYMQFVFTVKRILSNFFPRDARFLLVPLDLACSLRRRVAVSRYGFACRDASWTVPGSTGMSNVSNRGDGLK